MTIFDTKTDRYLERLGASHSSADWNDVVQRSDRARRHSRVTRAAVGVAAGAKATAVAFAAAGALGGGGTSIVDKAEAAVLAPVEAAPGTIEHILVRYRTDSGETFIEHETWIAGDGESCRRTVEGLAGRAPDTRLTICLPSDDVIELYLPGENQILRARVDTETANGSAREDPGPAAAGEGPRYFRVRLLPDGSTKADLVVKRNGKFYKVLDVGTDGSTEDLPSREDWLREDIIDAFRRDAPTLLCYGAISVYAFWLYAYGPALALLQTELHFSYTVLGVYSALWSAGAVVTGACFARLARRLPRAPLLWSSAAGAAPAPPCSPRPAPSR